MGIDTNEHLERLERRLHQFSVRTNRESLEKLLHDDFKEFGRSGRIYNKSDVLNQVDLKSNFSEIFSEKFEFKPLSDTVILLTYHSYLKSSDGITSCCTLRSSVWQFEEDSWQLVFHQGTPL